MEILEYWGNGKVVFPNISSIQHSTISLGGLHVH